MLDLTPVILTVIAMATYLISLFLLQAIIKRVRGGLKQTFAYIFAAIFILFTRRILNLLNLAAFYDAEILDDSLAILVSSLLLISLVTFFRDIQRLTDVEVNHRKEARLPPPKHTSFRGIREQEPARRSENERRAPAELSAKDLVKR